MRHQVFHDFDAYAESIRNVDCSMMLINPKRRIWTSSYVDLGGIAVQAGQLGSGNLVQGELRRDGYFLYLPLTHGIEHAVNGTVLPGNSFAIIEPGSEFCISTSVEHDWCAAFVPTLLLTQHIAGFPSSSIGATCPVAHPNRHAADRFRSIVLQIMDTAANCSEFESTAAARAARREVLNAAIVALGEQRLNAPSRGRRKIARHQIIRSCLDVLERSADCPIGVSDLAAAADVSERTVRTAFNEYFGIGPLRYLLMRQLQQVRRALTQADPGGATVAKLLVDHGVWEFSRFANRYRRLFGELPSETLRGSPACRG